MIYSMKNLALLPMCMVFLLACGGGGEKSDPNKPVTVDEIRATQKDKPDDFKTKYLGKKVVLVGKVFKLPATYPGAFDTFGHQDIMLSGSGDARGVNCQVTEAEFAKFKDIKEGDVVTVTGTVKAGESTMDLENCSKHTAAK